MASHVLGIDVSTTATKAILVDEAGTVVGVGSAGYDYDVPAPLWSEQDPQLWWNGAQAAIRGALANAGIGGDEVAAVGLAGQMHGAVLLDDADRPLRPAILWNDQRTAAECDEIRELVGAQRLIEVTGNDALTGFTAPKLLWVRQHEPEVWARVAHVLLPKDFVRHRLTGDHAVDRADGAGTLLFDLAARDWSPGGPRRPRHRSGLAAADRRRARGDRGGDTAAAQATGLAAGTPVVAGGGDQAANGVGVGAVDPGVVALSLGTSGVVFAATDRPLVEPEGRVHAFCHAVPGRWHLMSVMLSAAGSLRWFRDALAPGVRYAALDAEAGSVAAGSDGLVFLPYLTGERSPHTDPLARGAFVGLTVTHDRRHLARAVLEGVAYGLRDGLDQMVATGVPRTEADPRLGRRHRQRGLAPDPGRRARCARSRPSARPRARRSAPRCWPPSAPAGSPASTRRPPGRSESRRWPSRDQTAPTYAEGLATYRALYPALRPIFHLESDRP